LVPPPLVIGGHSIFIFNICISLFGHSNKQKIMSAFFCYQCVFPTLVCGQGNLVFVEDPRDERPTLPSGKDLNNMLSTLLLDLLLNETDMYRSSTINPYVWEPCSVPLARSEDAVFDRDYRQWQEVKQIFRPSQHPTAATVRVELQHDEENQPTTYRKPADEQMRSKRSIYRAHRQRARAARACSKEAENASPHNGRVPGTIFQHIENVLNTRKSD
jgi:hypothetical protein